MGGGASWWPQVRFLHLALLAVGALTLLYVYVASSSPAIVTQPPAHLVHNASEPLLVARTAGEGGNGSGSAANATTASLPPPPAAPDLTRGVPAELIYEAGHSDVGAEVCPDLGRDLRLLIAITSAPSHAPARMAIRQTWGHFAARRDVAVAFMLGATGDATLRRQMAHEAYLYSDIIAGRFVDTYDNLTLKTISMLEWVDSHCPRAAFVLKTDDDMFINVARLMLFVAQRAPEQRAIYGRLAKKWKPIRNRKSKYYISPQQYRPPVFPDFTTGPAYLLPARLARDLYTAALNHTYFKLEDVFVTGIVADGLNIRRVHAPEFLNKRVALTPCAAQRAISIHMVKGAEQYDLWKKLLDGATKCK